MTTKTQQDLIKLGAKLVSGAIKPAHPPKPRNYLARNPLLKKGGIHAKDDVVSVRKQQRRKTKQQLRRTDWLSAIKTLD